MERGVFLLPPLFDYGATLFVIRALSVRSGFETKALRAFEDEWKEKDGGERTSG